MWPRVKWASSANAIEDSARPGGREAPSEGRAPLGDCRCNHLPGNGALAVAFRAPSGLVDRMSRGLRLGPWPRKFRWVRADQETHCVSPAAVAKCQVDWFSIEVRGQRPTWRARSALQEEVGRWPGALGPRPSGGSVARGLRLGPRPRRGEPFRGLNRPVDSGGQVDQAFGGSDPGQRADLVQHLIQDLGVGGGELHQQIEPARGGEDAFNLGDCLQS